MGVAVREEDRLRFRLPSFQRRLARARSLIDRALATGQRAYVAYSGGKDSLVTLALVAERLPGVLAVWSDDELEYPEQPEHVVGSAAALGAELLVTFGWTEHAGWFVPWRMGRWWRDPLPGTVWVGDTVHRWMRSRGYGGTFLGLREAENGRRRAYLRGAGPWHRAGEGWLCCPLAGWSDDDVWAAIAGLELPYSPVYDRLAGSGAPRAHWRVGPLPLSPRWALERWPGLLPRLEERYGPRWS